MSALQTQSTEAVRVIGTGRLSNPAITVPMEIACQEIPQYSDAPPADTASDVVAHEIDGRVSLVLNRMINELSECTSVVAIIAEQIENHDALHITTFAHPLDEKVREVIYAAERTLIDEFSSMTFDFHTRAPQIVDQRPLIPPAPYALVLWHRP